MLDKKPNFFILGAPKSGTSAMRHYLSQHPEVYFAVPDEPGFFDGKFRYVRKNQCHFRDMLDYLSIYSSADIVKHKVIAEGSVYMLYDVDIIYDILNLNPDSRFMIMLRDPVDGVVSMHGENLKPLELGREPYEKLEQAWKDVENRSNMKELAGVHPMRFRYNILYSYAKHVKAVLDLATTNRVKIVLYDDFKANNVEVFHSVCKFLNISTNFSPDTGHINSRSQAADNLFSKSVAWAIKESRKHNFLRFLRGRGYSLNRFTQKRLSNPTMEDEFYAELRKYFYGDIKELEEILELDLSFWYLATNKYRKEPSRNSAGTCN